ncbi:hypothetical protein B0H17DRAFT_1127231 [Mycena rosella]|uniref:Uncharacterized protein n=1 Tax=Mycena rosella TaxID=1033263 RepID=A0AAD7E284_MYCRO|nr:hypothetical protein B0H17DRAFT_1127231 [Mycena rosella]
MVVTPKSNVVVAADGDRGEKLHEESKSAGASGREDFERKLSKYTLGGQLTALTACRKVPAPTHTDGAWARLCVVVRRHAIVSLGVGRTARGFARAEGHHTAKQNCALDTSPARAWVRAVSAAFARLKPAEGKYGGRRKERVGWCCHRTTSRTGTTARGFAGVPARAACGGARVEGMSGALLAREFGYGGPESSRMQRKGRVSKGKAEVAQLSVSRRRRGKKGHAGGPQVAGAERHLGAFGLRRSSGRVEAQRGGCGSLGQIRCSPRKKEAHQIWGRGARAIERARTRRTGARRAASGRRWRAWRANFSRLGGGERENETDPAMFAGAWARHVIRGLF